MLAYYGDSYPRALMHLFPDIGLDKSKFIRKTEGIWFFFFFALLSFPSPPFFPLPRVQMTKEDSLLLSPKHIALTHFRRPTGTKSSPLLCEKRRYEESEKS